MFDKEQCLYSWEFMPSQQGLVWSCEVDCILQDAANNRFIDIRKLQPSTGICTYDPGYTSTGTHLLSAESHRSKQQTRVMNSWLPMDMRIINLGFNLICFFPGSCNSTITYIDGKKGVLLYRG